MSQLLKEAALAALEAIDNFDDFLHLLVPGKADALYDAKRDLKRALFEIRINELAEHGEIAVVESGRDCDCVQYSGRVTIIQATLEAFEAHESDVNDWADGPFRLDIMRPSEAEGISYSSCDLVMQAFEDGHPHRIYSEFP